MKKKYLLTILAAIPLALILPSCDEDSTHSSEPNDAVTPGDDGNPNNEENDGNIENDGNDDNDEDNDGDDANSQTNDNLPGNSFQLPDRCYGNTPVKCGEQCINPKTEHDYCGASLDCKTYKKCASDEKCILGECRKKSKSSSVSCEDGLVVCDGMCINPNTNKLYCGASSTCTGYRSCIKNYHSCEDGNCYLSVSQDPFMKYLIKYFDKDHDQKISLAEADEITALTEHDDLLCQMTHLDDLERLDNLKSIGKHVFDGCSGIIGKDKSWKFRSKLLENLDDYAFRGTGLQIIQMDVVSGVNTEPGSEGMTFADSHELTTIYFPLLTKTSFNMFKNCDKLISTDNKLRLPKIETISRGTFAGCTGLTSITLTAKRVDSEVFADATGIELVRLKQINKIGFDENDKEGTTFSNNPNLKYLFMNHKGDIEVSSRFAAKDVAAHTVLMLYQDKKPESGNANPKPIDNEWPPNSGIVWKEITFGHTDYPSFPQGHSCETNSYCASGKCEENKSVKCTDEPTLHKCCAAK